MNNKWHNNSFFINTLVVTISGFLIKALGLLNRIIITRMLGTEGMSLYILAFPTIMLLITMSSLSMNITISKLVAENLKTRELSPKLLIKKGLKITTIASLFTIFTLLIIIKPLTSIFLKNANLFYPLLVTIFLIPLVGISDTLKGYYNALKQMTTTALAQLLEQVARITFSILAIIILAPYGIVIATTFTLLALSVGEAFSIIYLLVKLRKQPLIDFESTGNEQKEILKMAIPTTATRLVGSFSYFLEPIVYTMILIFIGYSEANIQTSYTIINGYAIPLLTIASFLSIGLSTTIIPSISEAHAQKKTGSINYLIQKILLFSLIPGILIAIILTIYAFEYMQLIYGTTSGATYVSKYAFLFITYYLTMPITSIMQALGKARVLFVVSTFFNILRIILIMGLSFFDFINLDSIFFAIIITLILNTIVNIIIVVKTTKYRFNYHNIINIMLISTFTLGLTFLLKNVTSLNYLLVSTIVSAVYLILNYTFGLLDVESFKKKKLKLEAK